ncbi:hypothetical protein CVT24_001064 [Panaeolus cyanescens]|uniref:Endonuclease/exonuclease/phosphatase domain-containing protein n=1 Tax=Panaeolus cyanescens TaxID=181874 RepID=A0A409VX06_9AGAR|nr:hypothetical protein CVT24_001064 [Panaeolus cyanescens]
MSGKKSFQPTPEQLALAQQKKEQRAANRQVQSQSPGPVQVDLVSRPWKPIPIANDEIVHNRTKIMTWNEVDRLDKLLPMLELGGYSHCYASGPAKQHGCLIAFKKALYSLQAQHTVEYDTSSLEHNTGNKRPGNSFRTRNIGLIVSLKSNTDNQRGLLVATTHLFWHPKYTYERIRQMAILVRETLTFRQVQDAQTWPVIVAGDFNFTPNDPAYALLFHKPLLPQHEETIAPSYVVHSSVDPSVSTSLLPGKISCDDESEAVDPDRVITNARPARAEDGQLSVCQIVDLYSTFPKPRSAYHDAITLLRNQGDSIPSFGSQLSALEHSAPNEPEYTSYTHYWKSVLDYIFIFDPIDKQVNVSGILAPMSTADMEPGLPRLGVSGSDHTSLVTEISW